MYKLLGILAIALLYVPTAYGALTCETPITVDEYNGGTTAQKWGESNAHNGVGEMIVYDHDYIPTSLTLTLAKNGNPVDMVYAIIVTYDPFYGAFRYVKSTAQTIASTTPQDYTFDFTTDEHIIPAHKMVVFGIFRTGAPNAQAYNLYGDVLSDFDGWINNDFAYNHDAVTVGATYSLEGLQCDETTTATSSTDVTEAIYTTGYMAQVYFGILLMLIFGYIGFRFTKIYI